MKILADSNFVIDLIEDSEYHKTALKAYKRLSNKKLIINQIIYAEISIAYNSKAELDARLKKYNIKFDNLIWEAGFIAGKCFLRYKSLGGIKTSPMPDFYIGAHADFLKIPLLTRDPKTYKFYFPNLKLITPE